MTTACRRRLDIRPGDFVAVPLNHRSMIGVAWDARSAGGRSGGRAPAETGGRSPAGPADDRQPAPLRRLGRGLYAQPARRGAAHGHELRRGAGAAGAAGRLDAWPLPGGNAQPRHDPGTPRVLAAMQPGEAHAGGPLAEAAKVSPGVLRGMADDGLISPALLPRPSASAGPTRTIPARRWAGAQAEAAAALVRAGGDAQLRRHPADRRHRLRQDRGLSGRGGRGLRQGRQALVLLPEIALSAQWLDRFKARFGCRPGALAFRADAAHPAASTWRAVAEGRAPVVVGARSALFLPFPDLGLVVVDEEHETAFKQEEGVVYHARDMAVVRARLAAAACVLVSATPSLESLTNAESGPLRGAGPAGAAWRGDAAGGGDGGPPPHPAGARPLHRAAADRGGDRDPGAGGAGDALPQPPRLRAADALPALRPPDALPELHRLAGGAPGAAAAAMPPLRPYRGAAGGMPGMRLRRTAWWRSAPGWSGCWRRRRRSGPRRGGW